MRSLPFSSIRGAVLLIALLFLSGGIGYRLGEKNVQIDTQGSRVLIRREAPPGTEVDFSLFWDVWGRVTRFFIDADTIDPQKMLYGAITGAVGSLGDPYTAFYPPKENKEFKEELGGTFEGIGAQLGMKENRVIVIAPLAGMPAEKAGIRAGDWILKVNDEETVGWSVAQAVTKIRGPRGTTVSLEILHENDPKPTSVSLTRDNIIVAAVEVWIKSPKEITEILAFPDVVKRNGRVAYLRLSRFGDRLSEEWKEGIDEILENTTKSDVKGMILDLRNNPGGYLEGSVFVASEFVDHGVVVSQNNSDGSKQNYEVDRKGRLLTVPLIVLINKGSASASEIVAGAIKDYARGRIIGETSFGKGSVQTPQDLPGGAGLHITTGKWFTPKGTSINNTGITPDIEVTFDYTEATRDGQLAKAVEELLK